MTFVPLEWSQRFENRRCRAVFGTGPSQAGRAGADEVVFRWWAEPTTAEGVACDTPVRESVEADLTTLETGSL